MSKSVLDFSGLKDRILHPFFSNPYLVDNRESIKKDVYDIIICERNDVNEEDSFLEVLKYSNTNTKIVIDLVQESGSLDYFLDWFYDLTLKYKKYKFYLIVDSKVNKKFKTNVKVLGSWKLCVLAFFENWGLYKKHDSFQRVPNLQIYKKVNGFLSLNGSINVNRILLLLFFIKNGLLEESLPSLLGRQINKNQFSFWFYSYNPTNPHKFDKSEYLNIVRTLHQNTIINDEDRFLLEDIAYSKLPIKTKIENKQDLETLNDFNYQLELNHTLYNRIINVVTENVPSIDDSFNKYNKSVTFTEKSLKHFKTHQIPLFIGQPGIVKIMRNLGFDVFDDFVNHSYDKETNIKKRIEMVGNELLRLTSLNCIDYYNNNIDRFKNNHVNIYKLKSEAFLELQSFVYENDLL